MVIGPFARTGATVPEYPQPLQKSPQGTNEKQPHFVAAPCNLFAPKTKESLPQRSWAALGRPPKQC